MYGKKSILYKQNREILLIFIIQYVIIVKPKGKHHYTKEENIMIFSSFLTVLLTEIVKPFIATVLSVVMALTSVLTGPMGEYTKLSAKTLGFDPMHTKVDYEITFDAGDIIASAGENFEIPEISGLSENGIFSLESSFDIYTDLENMRYVLESGDIENKEYAVYLDTGAFAVSPDLTKDLIAFAGEEYTAAYDKHFAGKTFFVSFDEFFGQEELIDAEELKSTTDLIKAVLEDAGKAMTTEENIKLLSDVYKPILENAGKFYSETAVDGVKAYTCKMTGSELVEYYSDTFETVYSEETLDSMFKYAKAIVKALDFTKYAEAMGVPAEEVAIPTDEELDEVFTSAKEEMLAEGAEINALFQLAFDMLLTGENIESLGELAIIYEYLDDSYMQSTIYEKDGAIHELSELVVSNGEKTLLTLKVTAVTKEYEGEVTAASRLFTSEQALDLDVLMSKAVFEKAVSKGVDSIEISWYSEMSPEYTAPAIDQVYFDVYYKTLLPEYEVYSDYQTNPDFPEDEKALIKEMFDNKFVFESDDFDSSAHLIDGSVYLPLRQIMESAGYEVSWDGEARKAYVTVSGEKIDMTGTIIGDRTYVKVRDFEKLGATVDYEEYLYNADAYNDFQKSCYATITFAK